MSEGITRGDLDTSLISSSSSDNNNDHRAQTSSKRRTSNCQSLQRQLLFLGLAMALLVSSCEAAPQRRAFKEEGRINRRGFKSSLLSTARGFGKRASAPATPLQEAR